MRFGAIPAGVAVPEGRGSDTEFRLTMASGAEKSKKAELEAVLACTSYGLCSILLSLCNKLVFSGADFNYPLAILAFQSLCAVCFLKGSDVLGLSKPLPLQRGAARRAARACQPPARARTSPAPAAHRARVAPIPISRAELFRLMLPVTLLFCAMLWTSGKALRHCSMPLFTVCKNLAVVGTTVYEFFRFGQSVSAGIVASLALMTAGSLIAGHGDMTATAVGMLWLLANVAATIAYLAVLKERMPADVSSASKSLHNNVLTLVVFTTAATGVGELGPFCRQISAQSVGFQLGTLMTGVLGTAINMTTFWCMHVTNGATYAFVGASNKVPVALIGHYFFHSVITPMGWCGVALGLGAGLVYAVTKERERQQREHAASSSPEAQSLLRAGSQLERAEGASDGDESDGDGHGCAHGGRTARSCAAGRAAGDG